MKTLLSKLKAVKNALYKAPPSVLFLWLMYSAFGFAIICIFLKPASFKLLFFGYWDYFSDFFNIVRDSAHLPLVHQSLDGAPYPTLAYMLLYPFAKMLPPDLPFRSIEAFRQHQDVWKIFVLYFTMICGALTLLFNNAVKSGTPTKILFAAAMLFSAPFLFAFERGNIILISFVLSGVFILFYNSKNKILKETAFLALAIAAAIKMFPAVLGLLLIKEKRYQEAMRLIIYGLLFFFVPFVATGAIFESMLILKNNLASLSFPSTYDFAYNAGAENAVLFLYSFFINPSPQPLVFALAATIPYACLILGFLSFAFTREYWKSVAILCLLMALVPASSGFYTLIFVSLPLIIFFNKESRQKNDGLYAVLFALTFAPLLLGIIDFEDYYGKMIYTGMTINRFAALFMFIALCAEGLSNWRTSKKNTSRRY